MGNQDERKPLLDVSQSKASAPIGDPVDAALAVALERASLAGQWTAVEVLARELESRRKARAGVLDFSQARAKRRD